MSSSADHVAPPAATGDHIRIASWPHWYAPNLYLPLFYGALHDHGVDHVPFFPIDTPAAAAATEIDVLHLHWAYPYWRDGGRGSLRQWLRVGQLQRQLTALKRTGVRLVWTLHNLEHHEGSRAADHRADRMLHRLADLRIVHSQHALAELRHRTRGGDIVCMRHGNYEGAMPPPAPRDRTRASVGAPPGAKLLLCFGQLREYKGFDVAVRAVAALPPGDFHLVIAGRPVGAVYDKLASVSAHRANMHLEAGDLTDQRLADLLHAADAVLLPFRSITTSGTLLHALTFGRPVVVTDLPYFREMLGSSAAATYATPGDADSLAAGILRLMAVSAEERESAARAIGDAHRWGRVVEPVVAWLTKNVQPGTAVPSD
jgi:beta-1,4-mannosyltransferase